MEGWKMKTCEAWRSSSSTSCCFSASPSRCKTRQLVAAVATCSTREASSCSSSLLAPVAAAQRCTSSTEGRPRPVSTRLTLLWLNPV